MPLPDRDVQTLLLGTPGRQRMRVLQSLLGVPALLLMQCVILVDRLNGHGTLLPVCNYVGLTLLGCSVFYALLRSGLSDRLSSEASLSRPQMLYAMLCVGWGYVLAGPSRTALLLLMPLILSFGVFALTEQAVRGLSWLGTLIIAVAIAVRTEMGLSDFSQDLPAWMLLAVAMGSIGVLARRMTRMRERLREQKAELSQALESIQDLASKDPLTGLLNRAALLNVLQSEVQRRARLQSGVTLALVDLDHFKVINDQLGHRAGDHALQAFAEATRSCLRSSDIVGRWGGEEFLLVMVDSEPPTAFIVLERLRAKLRCVQLGAGDGSIEVTFSAGIAQCMSMADLDKAIDRADAAMYRAKVNGRDQTVFSAEVHHLKRAAAGE